ncbi:hypothetical protein C8R21_13615 [Nitrosospira multiformis]|uniref:Uncharacterized protein n=1 Tax=Nitrosospira multiformis TaxID=1231 RepID=A0A2T5I5B6_9PROT|nr:hypothetical protein C8R21_13615 [Nitrosospira multiformis]
MTEEAVNLYIDELANDGLEFYANLAEYRMGKQ